MVNRIEDLPKGDPTEYIYGDSKQCIHENHHQIFEYQRFCLVQVCDMCLEWIQANEHHKFIRKRNHDYRHEHILFYWHAWYNWERTHPRIPRQHHNLNYNIFLMMRIRYHTSEEKMETWTYQCPFYRWVEFHDIKLGLELSNKMRVVL